MGDWDLGVDPLAALARGDRGPFEAFVRTHARVLVAWFRRQGAGLHRAEDLTQDVFLKLHSHAPRYRAEERFPAFCLRVARNVWIDDCRRRGVRPEGLSLESARDPDRTALVEALGPERVRLGPRPAPSPVRGATLSESVERLRAALAELPVHHREVFELGAIEGLPYPEIAATLGVPVGTVKSRMFYAVRRLREVLGDGPDEGGAEDAVEVRA